MKPLSAYHRRAFAESIDYWKKRVVLNTDSINRGRAEDAVVAVRKLLGAGGRPFFHWFERPIDAMAYIATSSAESLSRKRYLSDELTPFFKWMDSPHTLNGHLRQILQNANDQFKLRSWEPLIFQSTHFGTDRKQRPAEIFKPEMSQFTSDIHKYLFAKERLALNVNVENSARIEIAAEIARSCCLWWNHEDTVIMSERPTKISLDDADRLHSISGPAFCYGEKFQKYLVHGIQIEPDIIKDPYNCLTPNRIEKERNAEVRRTLLELYGSDRYLRKTGAVIIHEGRKGTKLWWRPPIESNSRGFLASEADTIFSASDQPLVMVEVVNSTPEPDGSIKHYFLRVPPTMRNADEAVAWTFGLTLAEYEPYIET